MFTPIDGSGYRRGYTFCIFCQFFVLGDYRRWKEHELYYHHNIEWLCYICDYESRHPISDDNLVDPPANTAVADSFIVRVGAPATADDATTGVYIFCFLKNVGYLKAKST